MQNGLRHRCASATPHRERAAPRIKLFEPGTLAVDGAETRVHLLNASLTGALCHAAAEPAPGAMVRLTVRGLNIVARVVWRDGLRFGVAFAVRLRQDELTRLSGA